MPQFWARWACVFTIRVYKRTSSDMYTGALKRFIWEVFGTNIGFFSSLVYRTMLANTLGNKFSSGVSKVVGFYRPNTHTATIK
jgi:hypothetical protein